MPNQRRIFKISERVREVLANALQHTADDRFSLVSITSVMVSPDLGDAKIYWTVSESGADKEDVALAFKGAKGYFRSLLAKEIDTRRVPNLNFFYDDTLDASAEVERLLANLRASSN